MVINIVITSLFQDKVDCQVVQTLSRWAVTGHVRAVVVFFCFFFFSMCVASVGLPLCWSFPLWNSETITWIRKYHKSLHQHDDEQYTGEISAFNSSTEVMISVKKKKKHHMNVILHKMRRDLLDTAELSVISLFFRVCKWYLRKGVDVRWEITLGKDRLSAEKTKQKKNFGKTPTSLWL